MIPPNESRGFIHKRIGKALRRFGGAVPVIGGGLEAIGGLIGGGVRPPVIVRAEALRGAQLSEFAQQLKSRRMRPPVGTVPGLPPTPTVTTPAEFGITGQFQAVTGAFGLPAMAPIVETRQHLKCAKGMVLGEDNLCYPKQVLRRNSRFRKWRGSPRPPISAADAKLFRRLNAARERVKDFAKDVDLKVTKKT